MAEKVIQKGFTGGRTYRDTDGFRHFLSDNPHIFVSNGYVVYRYGLAGLQPNWYGVHQGDKDIERMLYNMDSKNAQLRTINKFITYLSNIAKHQDNKQRLYLTKKISELKDKKIYSQQYLRTIQSFLDNQKPNYGAMFTLIRQGQESIKRVQKQMQSSNWKGLQHTGQLAFKKQKAVSEFFAKKISENFKILDASSGEDKIQRMIQSNQTIEEFIKEFIQEQGLRYETDAELNDYVNLFFPGIRDLLRKIQNNKDLDLSLTTQIWNLIEVDKLAESMKEAAGKRSPRLQWKSGQKKGKGKDIKALFAKYSKDVCLGMMQQASSASVARQGNSFVHLTGNNEITVSNIYGEKSKVKQTNDIISFEWFNVDVKLDEYASTFTESINQPVYERTKFLQQKFRDIASKEEPLFILRESVKSYRSNWDLKIKQQASFAQREAHLQQIFEQTGITGFNKFIFLLNNTVEGALACNDVDRISDLIASVCVLYMWDEMTEDFIHDDSGSKVQSIYLFNSGGVYLTSSQVIYDCIDRIQALWNRDLERSRLVNVSINTSSYDLTRADMDYVQSTKLNGAQIDESMTNEQRERALKIQWDYIKNRATHAGKLGISLRQKELERLLGNLEGILRSNNF